MDTRIMDTRIRDTRIMDTRIMDTRIMDTPRSPLAAAIAAAMLMHGFWRLHSPRRLDL